MMVDMQHPLSDIVIIPQYYKTLPFNKGCVLFSHHPILEYVSSPSEIHPFVNAIFAAQILHLLINSWHVPHLQMQTRLRLVHLRMWVAPTCFASRPNIPAGFACSQDISTSWDGLASLAYSLGFTCFAGSPSRRSLIKKAPLFSD